MNDIEIVLDLHKIQFRWGRRALLGVGQPYTTGKKQSRGETNQGRLMHARKYIKRLSRQDIWPFLEYKLFMACNPEILEDVMFFSLLDKDERAVLAEHVELKTFAARQ